MNYDDLLSNEDRWLQLWRLDVPPKVKDYAWQGGRVCPSLFAL